MNEKTETLSAQVDKSPISGTKHGNGKHIMAGSRDYVRSGEVKSLGEAHGRNVQTLFIALSVHEENQKAKACIGEDEKSECVDVNFLSSDHKFSKAVFVVH